MCNISKMKSYKLIIVYITVGLFVLGEGNNPQNLGKHNKLRHQGGRESSALIHETQELTDASSSEKTVTACEGGRLTVECAEGRVIQVQRANYGRTSPTTCNERGSTRLNTNCRSARAINIVSNRCDKRKRCEVDATNRRFRDPCPLTTKYLEVKYKCVQLKAPTTVAPVVTTVEASQTTELVTEREPTEAEKVSTEESGGTSGIVQPITKTTKPPLLTPGPGQPIKFCPAVKMRGIEWPRTTPGITRQALCPNNQEGYALWRCGTEYVIKWEGNPDLSQCVSPKIKVIKDKLKGGKERVEEIADEMVVVTKNEKLEGNDMLETADLMQNIMINMEKQMLYDDKPTRTRTVHKVSEAIVKTGSNMLSKDKVKSWRDLPQEEQAKVATSLVDTVEFSAFKLAENIEEPEVVTKVDINIVLTVNVISASPPVVPDVYFSPPTIHVQINLPSGTSTTTALPLRDAFSWRDNQMIIPGSVVKDQADKDGLSRLVFITYNNMDEILTPTVHNFYEDDQMQMDTNMLEPPTRKPMYRSHLNAPPRDRTYMRDEVNEIETIVNTQILSASFSGRKRNIPLVEPLTYTLEHIQTEDVNLEGTCVFWNYTDKMYDGQWSDNGCWRERFNKTHTTCQCNHLTNFAVLMDVMGTKLSKEHEMGLKVLTHIGCIISIICLALSFVTFVYFKNLQCDRNTIHKNLVLCLFLGEIIFLIGIDKTGNRVACGIVAGVLHYIFLAAFAWMCLEGIQLYVMLIEVFEAEKSRRLYYYLSAYGLPAILVGISAAVDYKSYGTETYCWLRADNGFIWAFVGPVLGVITINVIMLSIAIYMMCRHAATMANMKIKEKSRMDNARSWIKGAAVLIVLLGLTWAFGLMYLNKHTVAMAYLFTILNSLQGMFIFCFHCLMNEKVQKEYKRCVRHATWLPMCFRVKYGGYKSYPGSVTPQSSTSGNYLQKLLSGRRRKRSSTSSIPTKTSSTTQWHYHNMKSDGTIKSSKSSRSSRLSDPPPDVPKLPDEDTLEKKNPNRFIDASNGHMTITINNSLIDHGDGVNGDLSMIDASVIDSEAVTEYCKGGMGEGVPPETEIPVKNSNFHAPDNHYEEIDHREAPAEICVVSEKEPLVKRDSDYLEPQPTEIIPSGKKPVNEYENVKIKDNNVEIPEVNGEMSSSMIVDESASTPLLDVATAPGKGGEADDQAEEIASSSLLDDLNKYKIDTSKIDSKPKESEQETDNVCHSDSDSVVSGVEPELQSNGSTISIHTPHSISRSSLAATTPGGELDEPDDDSQAAERFEQALMSEDDVMVASQQSDMETPATADLNTKL